MTRAEYQEERRTARERVYSLHKSGRSKFEIAKMTGYSISYIAVLIRQMEGPAERRTMSEEHREKVLEMHKAGKKLREIAAEIGFSQAAVQRYIKQCEAGDDAGADRNEPTVVGYSSVPPGTVIKETVSERGEKSKIAEWTFVEQYPHHALFINKAGSRRCFPNGELIQRNIIHPQVV